VVFKTFVPSLLQKKYMKIKYIVPGVIMVAFFSACDSSSADEKENTAASPQSNTVPVSTENKASQQPVQVQPTQISIPQPGTVTSQPIPPVVNTAAPGLNPEHGKPGHRCDIAVGAPLNSKPAITNTPQAISPAPSPVTVNTSQPQKTVAPGMNPEHGKPGHRCDIAVGLPLDSKPGAGIKTVDGTLPQNQQSPVNLTTPPSIPQPVTIQPANKVAAPVTGTGLNPEHGKPGHRCDIAVGAPLNSKPVETKKVNQ
jgi:hypothetical protein